MRYLVGTPKLGLTYRSSERKLSDLWHLELYVDSNFAGDTEHRRSRYGYVIFLNENPIDFGTGLQKRTAASTPEAEYIALARGLKELLWI